LHDIGKKIVAMFFEGGGWEVIDLGVDVSSEKFIQAIDEHKPFAVGLSALLTTTMISMEGIAKEIKSRSAAVKVIVGGAPVTKDFADRIGADAYSPDPQGALDFLNAVVHKI
jgi:5-methyltetrahydrofolate--homocysteine methyltransferase